MFDETNKIICIKKKYTKVESIVNNIYQNKTPEFCSAAELSYLNIYAELFLDGPSIVDIIRPIKDY